MNKLLHSQLTASLAATDPAKSRNKAKSGAPLAFLENALSWQSDRCLEWPFARGRNGYGHLYVEQRRLVGAHRQICKRAHGLPPSPSYEAAHSCGNKGCVNPRHLRWATSSQNKSDMIAHGTVLIGERNPMHMRPEIRNWGERNGMTELTSSQVLEIFGRKGCEPQKITAAHFGISQTSVSDIQRRKRWGWLTMPIEKPGHCSSAETYTIEIWKRTP